jgi:hypothetical protein
VNAASGTHQRVRVAQSVPIVLATLS